MSNAGVTHFSVKVGQIEKVFIDSSLVFNEFADEINWHKRFGFTGDVLTMKMTKFIFLVIAFDPAIVISKMLKHYKSARVGK